MVPKIVFRYSSVYDQKWKKLYYLEGNKKEYPSEKKVRGFMEKAEKEGYKNIIKMIKNS